ncbi:MFS general substrate transporter [Aulographum hederae CBS 113979]|uniref:MFS general substrate transporter n=1 Tax=Aulographum hederae CBS 113979 TaxID=1176131 RepID=A0A6G1H863_9PEZI|nr:MFS general substrate transporter [Aulographum hederae CBS 113979]
MAPPPSPLQNGADERTPLLANGYVQATSEHAPLETPTGYENLHGEAQGPSEEGDIQPHRNDGDSYSAGESSKSEYLGGVSNAKFWVIFGSVCALYFVACFDNTLMASSHPVITSYFNASNAATWLSTSFMLTSTSFQPLFARISDTIGRKPLYLFALIMFVLTTAWCAVAQSIGSFIAARAACGLGAGGVMAMGSIMTNDLVPIEIRGTYQAYINLAYGLGSACGAAFGGFLCDSLGWRWTFGIQIPPVLVILGIAIFTTPTSLGPHIARKDPTKTFRQHLANFDLLGSFLLAVSVAFLILFLNLGGNIYPWKHGFVIGSLVIFLVSAPLLLYVESRAKLPVMPLSMLFSKPRGVMVFNNFFGNMGFNIVIFHAPLYFQAVKLESASTSGFRLALPSLLLTVCGVGSGLFLTRTGRMLLPMVLGSLVALAGSVALSSMWDDIPAWLAMLFVCPISMGQGLLFPATSVAVLAVSDVDDQAIMTTTLVLWRSLGTVLGVAIGGLVVQNALVAYLHAFVTGKNSNKVIHLVRKSVRAIQNLPPKHQHQVILAYEASLRLTFITAIVIFVVMSCLLIPVQLPRLGRRKSV